jgi:pimeloyl-ACP methyl ester carboxylesterase
MESRLETFGCGEKVLFLHGAGGSTRSWFFQKESLKARCQVVLADLPGHGQAGGDACESIEAYRDSIYRAMAAGGKERYFIAGHSMGGAIALSLALKKPGALKGIILVCTGARLKVFPEILEGIMKEKEKTVRKIIDLAFSKGAPPEMKENGYQEYMKSRRETILRDFLACDSFDITGSLGDITVPAFIICGADDVLTPPRYSRFLQGAIPGSRLAVIENAGHMVMLEQPGAVNQAIESFLQEYGGE